MPIYEFECHDCGHDFEQLVRSMVSQEDIVCPHCGGQHVKKTISLFGGVGGSQRSGGTQPQSCAPTG